MKRCPLCETDYPNQYSTCEADGVVLVATHDLDPGTLVRNKYRIVRKVGRGGMGTVYLADHLLLGKQRALKFIAGDLAQDPKLLKRFRLEALAAIELRHPNIAEVFDLDQAEDGAPFIAMEYVAGRDLRAALRAGPMPIPRALLIAQGVAFGLAAAHHKGIVHRDVKPENILLASEPAGPEIPKLVDFGIAAIRDRVTSVGRTRTGVMLTPDFAAPEQWLGLSSDQIDGRADLYALGGVLHEMLTGRNWLVERNAADAQESNTPPPSHWRPELHQWPGLEQLVLHLLAEDRNQRPQNVSEFLHKLDAVQRKQPIPRTPTLLESAPAATTEPVARPRRRTLLWTAATAVAASLCLFAVFFWFSPPRAGSLRQNPKDGLTYVWIPPSNFTRGFWLGQTPVTVAAWQRYRAATNAPALLTEDSLHRNTLNEAGPANAPVVFESWYQAQGFCQWSGFTLPSEAQWEYAARAGTTADRYGDPDAIAWFGDNSGNQPIDAAAWSRAAGIDRSAYEQRLKDNGNFAHPVALKRPNAWNLYDMLGNVLEWTTDSADNGKKVIRGASWANTAADVRFSSRTAIDPNRQLTAVGFRCLATNWEGDK